MFSNSHTIAFFRKLPHLSHITKNLQILDIEELNDSLSRIFADFGLIYLFSFQIRGLPSEVCAV